ncbi:MULTISPECIES: NAD(P)-dependent oxidoreductase [unclassified Oleiphilus]|uniref:NAD(P)-dependent oxidoreductase n=1 Tax=unclassified Oleiphilus TaxID=2631174 RepID=UPI0007C40304|nr:MULTISPECIES: NAD(P)-dependent oxidoreductase [unclassified Oleiphilus]KZY45942.1 2-hydroxy-3-oxopropionate reductase [Oleiphilus sp. HI0050]KZY75728.1 2-hydroxy-3-oxopropionate reductase [Oleiphilus sp. HI0068]KZY88400.1 2-hydroxy-3-oxopropionate reductase [Oleiphilus sp. HI0069]KZZ17396.1 2-hydroxy-3-oxopropionate reductase [Oleiphilus sp. HI0078]KZZ19744.1 2-hydroxy-3-oxopropionate reductase [Oleiphilus sp. HI0081]KZZ30446.1 2-hydroxy-3-oxopropionate reductase [Oleiphilus sp. HI0085]
MKIAFLGIGLMGYPMTQKLLDAGFELLLWNRTAEKMADFADKAELCASAAEAISQAEIIISMLENGDIVDQVIYQSQAYQSAKPNSLFIDMSSIPPSTARKHAQLAKQHQCHYLDAPVSGGTAGAQAATLSVMAGGDKQQFERAQELFQAFGKSTYIGDTGSGQLCKLANQAIVGITIGAVSEALLLASEGGADPEAVREALSGGFAASRILELHGQRMLERNFEPGATSRVQLKDLKTILDEARNEGLTLPLSQRTYESYLSLVANGNENVDHSGLLLELEHMNQTQLKSTS